MGEPMKRIIQQGDFYQSQDRRDSGRVVMVEWFDYSGAYAFVRNVKTDRRTRIKISALESHIWKLKGNA